MVRKTRTEKSNVSSFEDVVSIRLKHTDRKDIEKIIKNDADERYGSESHFIRCAVRKQIREEKARVKL